MQMRKFEVEVLCPLTDDEVQYVLECWATFVMCDLGKELKDMIMIETVAPTPLQA